MSTATAGTEAAYKATKAGWNPAQVETIVRFVEEGCDYKTAVRKMRTAEEAAAKPEQGGSKHNSCVSDSPDVRPTEATETQTETQTAARQAEIASVQKDAEIVAATFEKYAALCDAEDEAKQKRVVFAETYRKDPELQKRVRNIREFFAHKKVHEYLLGRDGVTKHYKVTSYFRNEAGVCYEHLGRLDREGRHDPRFSKDSVMAHLLGDGQISGPDTKAEIDSLAETLGDDDHTARWAEMWLSNLRAAALQHPDWRDGVVNDAVRYAQDNLKFRAELEERAAKATAAKNDTTQEPAPPAEAGPAPVAERASSSESQRKCDVQGCVKCVVPDWIVKMGGDGTKCYDHGGNVWGPGSGRVPLCSLVGCYEKQELRDPTDTHSNTGFCAEHGHEAKEETTSGPKGYVPAEPKPLHTAATPSQMHQAAQQRANTAEPRAANLKNDLQKLVSEIIVHKSELPAWLFELAQTIRMRSLPPEVGDAVEEAAAVTAGK